jgi:hypothetical protein
VIIIAVNPAGQQNLMYLSQIAVQIISDGKGGHFGPDMVDAFLELQDEFQAIAARYADTDLDMKKKSDYLDQAITERI